MSFNVSADAYGRFMGRFSTPLAAALLDHLGPQLGARVLDVGCGPGALTQQLVDRLGADHVTAVDPSAPFVDAVRAATGAATVAGNAEQLPFADRRFDSAIAQLVVHFMTDPVAGLREMSRVTAPGGVVAASVWDNKDGGSPLSAFWQAARDLDPSVEDESARPGSAQGQLTTLATFAGVANVVESALEIEVPQSDFDEWWEPFTYGVGPAGAYAAGLSEDARERLRRHCQDRLPAGPFVVPARAWLVVGNAPITA